MPMDPSWNFVVEIWVNNSARCLGCERIKIKVYADAINIGKQINV